MGTGGQNISKYATLAQLEAFFINDVGMVTVKAYGAVGDGVTDDTVAILAAIADVTLRDLKSLYFPHGSYAVDSDLIGPADFTGIFCWGDNSELTGITHPINQIGTNISLVTTFLGLTDSPGTFSGQAGKVLAVNTGETALEYTTTYTQTYIDDTFYTTTELGTGALDGRYYTETELLGGALNGLYFTETELLGGALNGLYFTETELSAGALNDIYYTETEMDHGEMDKRYYTETEIDANFASKQDLADLILGVFPVGTIPGASIVDDSLTTAKMAAEQKRGGALGVASLDSSSKVIQEPASKAQASGVASLDSSSKVIQEPASKAQASGIASLDSSSKVVQEPASKGQANGIATLDGAGQVPVTQLGNVPASGTTQSYVDAGDLENSLQISKGLFAVQAQFAAGLNELSQMAIDVFNDDSGVDAGVSSGYAYDSGTDKFKSLGAFTRSSGQKTVTANGNARISTSSAVDGKTVTANGNAQIDTAQYKFGSSSGLFDGTDDYLSVPDSADWAFGSGDWTIRCFIRFATLPGAGETSVFVCQYQDNNNHYRFGVTNYAGTYKVRLNIVSSSADIVDAVSDGITVSVNTWYHFEVIHNTDGYKLFFDGALVGTDADSSDMPDIGGGLKIGTYNGATANSLIGHMDELEIAKGVARHTTNFTPPASALTADTYTKLLLHFEGTDASTTFTDSSAIAITPKVGSAMGYFDGTGDYLSTDDVADWDLGTGNFTLRAYLNVTTLPTNGNTQALISQYTDANNYWYWGIYNNSGTYEMKFINNNDSTTTTITIELTTPTLDTWYHWEVCRTGNNLKFFVDGTQVGTDQAFDITMVNSTGSLVVGGYNGGSYFYGYLDELEVAKGTARNTSGFTPSTSALVVDDYTMLMLHFEGSNDATTFTDTVTDTMAVAMTLVSDAVTASDVPEQMFVVVDETIVSGTVAYSVSRDDGSTWTAATKDTLIDVSAQPSGSECRIKAVTSAVAADAITINAWAFGYKLE